MCVRHPLAWAVGLAFVPSAWAAEPLEFESVEVSASAVTERPPEEATSPTQVLEGEELVMRREATLGETLEKLPGVRSSSFGAGAGRPIIRGLDGARVKLLSDGVDMLDASSTSPDHAVTSEPLLTQRIEVLKGPSTLLYGGGMGGVVNVIDSKVPTYVPEKGYEGEAEVRGNTVADGWAGAFGITAGKGPIAVRAEGSRRRDDDYGIPGSPSKQQSSFNDTDSFSLGSSVVGERGYLGLAYGEQNNRYGLVGEEVQGDEPVPYIDMKQKRWDLRGELSEPLRGFELAKLRAAHSNYRHNEVEDGAVATRFDNDASDARLELTHAPLLGWHGVLGGQTLHRDFKASGEEAYLPPTVTHSHGLFLTEEYTAGAWRYELGLRHDWQNVQANGAKDTSHQGTSLSAGVVWTFTTDYSLGLSLTRAQRLPSIEELYANGAHAATQTIEHGNPDLKKETSHNAELTLRKFAGRTTFDLTLYRNQVDDFIYAADTGRDTGDGGYRDIAYRQHDALLTGAEGQIRFQATDATALTLFGDHVRGRLRNGGGDLPRMPADRLGVRVDHSFSTALAGQLEYYRVRRQDRLADYETKTGGYNMLGANLRYSGTLGPTDYQIYLKGNNLLDEKARNHSSFVKDQVLLPGRNLILGMRLSF